MRSRLAAINLYSISVMTEQRKIPDAETRKRSVERLRESNRQLEAVTLALDELIAMVEADLRRQRRARLQGKVKLVGEEAN